MSARVEERIVEYFAVDLATGREMHVPHITVELAERWTGEGLHIVTRETRRLVPVFGALQTVLPEPVELPILAVTAESKLGQELGLPPGSVGFL